MALKLKSLLSSYEDQFSPAWHAAEEKEHRAAAKQYVMDIMKTVSNEMVNLSHTNLDKSLASVLKDDNSRAQQVLAAHPGFDPVFMKV